MWFRGLVSVFPVPIVVSVAPSGTVAPLFIDSIAEAIVCTLGSTLPAIISSIQWNAPLAIEFICPWYLCYHRSNQCRLLFHVMPQFCCGFWGSSGMFTLQAYLFASYFFFRVGLH